MSNPWLSFWLQAANTWAGAARGLWTAELHRQQSMMMQQMARETARFWTAAWAAPMAAKRTRRRR